MRILHVRLHHHVDPVAGRTSRAKRGSDQALSDRQSVPVRRLSRDHRGSETGRAQAQDPRRDLRSALGRPMSEQTIEFVKSTVARFPNLRPILVEHMRDDFGEILPHLFFSGLTRYVQSLLPLGASKGSQSELQEILDYLEEVYSRGNDELCELIAVSFLENLPRPGEPSAQIREMVGPRLRAQLQMIG